MTPPTGTAPTTTFSTPADREFRIERIFNAPRERVWRALTEPELVAQWWSRGKTLVIEHLELRPGGRWRYVVQHAKGGTDGFGGEYTEVKAPERIVRTSEWDGAKGHVVLETTTLETLPDGRTKFVCSCLFDTNESRAMALGSPMKEGLTDSYIVLDTLLATLA